MPKPDLRLVTCTLLPLYTRIYRVGPNSISKIKLALNYSNQVRILLLPLIENLDS